MLTTASISDTPHVQDLASRLNEQRKNGTFCDILLKVLGELRTIPTHSCVLSACSPFFQELIIGDRPHTPHLTVTPQEIVLDVPGLIAGVLPEGVAETIPEAEVAAQTVADIVNYIYTGEIDLKSDSVGLLVQLAETFMLDSLSSLGRSFLCTESDSVRIKDEEGSESEDTRQQKVLDEHPVNEAGELASNEVDAEDLAPTTAGSAAGRHRSRKRRRISSTLHLAKVVTEEEAAVSVDLDFGPSSRTSYTCRECGFVSADRQATRDHRMIHNGKSYVCSTCNYITIKASKLVAHLLSNEHPETDTCSLCRFVADTPEAFREHVRRHDHAEPFFCEQCDLRFRTRSTLTIHVAKHSADTPFACQHCPRAFKLKRSLQAHMVSHSGQKTHMCDYCGYRTAYKSSFNSHVLMHTGAIFVCTEEGCSFRSIRKKNLKDHILTHAPQKPYQCEVCGQNFSYEQSLKRHAKLHSPDKNLLTCNFCPFSTIRRDKLREHVRKHHKDGQVADQVDDMFHLI